MADNEITWLDLLRKRRDHFEKVFFQQESRAQFISTLTTGIAAALLTSAEGNLRHISTVGWVMRLWIVALLFLLITLLFALTTFFPLYRRRFDICGLDKVTNKIGFYHLKADVREFTTKPENDEKLCAFVKKVFAQEYPATSLDDKVVKAELYNLWAQWFVTERRTGLLRWTIILFAIALPLSGGAYFAIKDVTPTKESKVAEATKSSAMPNALTNAANDLPVPATGKRAVAPHTSPVTVTSAVEPISSATPIPSASSAVSSFSERDAGRTR